MPADGLTTDSLYATDGTAGTWVGRCLPGAVFYAKVFGIIYSAAGLAKQGRYDNPAWIASSIATIRALEAVGGRFEVEGLDIVRRLSSPCVFIGNHMSILETFVLPCLIVPHRRVTFVIKESLVGYPYFGHVMRSRDPVVVGRENAREDLRVVMEEGQKRLAGGISIVIFPQTTRSEGFDPRKFNSLGVKLAKKAGVPVVPVALKTDAWGIGKAIKDFGPIRPEKTVHIRFGEPMDVTGSGKEEHSRIVEFIEKNLAEWQKAAGNTAWGRQTHAPDGS
jgi:1-acyl-sn-glycerol-3-phosphate acyltransferase